MSTRCQSSNHHRAELVTLLSVPSLAATIALSPSPDHIACFAMQHKATNQGMKPRAVDGIQFKWSVNGNWVTSSLPLLTSARMAPFCRLAGAAPQSNTHTTEFGAPWAKGEVFKCVQTTLALLGTLRLILRAELLQVNVVHPHRRVRRRGPATVLAVGVLARRFTQMVGPLDRCWHWPERDGTSGADFAT